MSFQDIPTSEMINDLRESWVDYGMARLATKLGVITYGCNHSVQERMDGNMKIIETIEAELVRRGGIFWKIE